MRQSHYRAGEDWNEVRVDTAEVEGQGSRILQKTGPILILVS